MKRIFILYLLIIPLQLFAQQVTERNSTGPIPPKGVSTQGHSLSDKGTTTEKVISGVPSYIWFRGCGPTSLGMVLGYYDTHGYPGLLPGDGAVQTDEINQAIASDEHYNDYALPLDDAGTGIKPDLSELPTGDEHADNSIADFLRTSQSIRGNYWMWTLPSDIKPGWENYISNMASVYEGVAHEYDFRSFPWDSLVSNIDRDHPLVFLVDSDADGVYDHFVCVIGYGTDQSGNWYNCFDTWFTTSRWVQFEEMAPGNEFGVLKCFTFEIRKLPYIWAGNTSSDWTVSTNWQGNNAPPITPPLTITDDLIINKVNTGLYYPEFNNITIGNSSGVKGSVTVSPGAKVTLTSGLTILPGIGSLTVQSDASGDGMLLFNDGIQVGDANVELYLAGGLNENSARFHYFIPPVQSMDIGSSIASVKSALNITNFNGDLVCYNESLAVNTQLEGWQYFDGYGSPATIPFSSLESSQGYNIYFNDDDKITFKGKLNITQHTFNLTYTENNAGKGWNLVGNPYPTNYDLDGVKGLGTIEDGISNTVYYTRNGGYGYWNVYLKSGSSDGYSDIIPPMTGFFVRVSNASFNKLILPVSSKTFETADPRSVHKGNSFPNGKGPTIQKIRLVLTSGSKNDETIILLFDDATNSYNEHYDAYKLFGTNTNTPLIYSKLDGVDYFMKAIHGPLSEYVIAPLEVVLRESGNHTIKITEFENLQGLTIKLKHGVTEISIGPGSSYTFNAGPGTYSDFALVFENTTTGLNTEGVLPFKTWYSNHYLYINSVSTMQPGNGRLVIYDFNGRLVFSKNLYLEPGETNQFSVNLAKGFYVTDLVIDTIHYKSKILVTD